MESLAWDRRKCAFSRASLDGLISRSTTRRAAQPPRLVVMSYTPAGESLEHIALCGKGVCYDTGGLSLKPKTGMPGMKHGE